MTSTPARRVGQNLSDVGCEEARGIVGAPLNGMGYAEGPKARYIATMRIGPLKLKLQLVCSDAVAMGPGKADLLDAIEREGSIAAAGRALGMSYRRTWILVDEMNRCFQEKLVDTLSGGGRERGARVTPTGRNMLAAYRELEAATASSAEGSAYRSLVEAMRDRPLRSKPVSERA